MEEHLKNKKHAKIIWTGGDISTKWEYFVHENLKRVWQNSFLKKI